MSKHKKLLSLLLSAAMTASCMSGLALSAQAAQTEYVSVTFDEADYTAGQLVVAGENTNEATKGQLKFEVATRVDTTTYINIAEEDGNKYLRLAAGRFSTSSRHPKVTISGLPATVSTNYRLSFKVRFASALDKLDLKNSDGTTLYATVSAANAELNKWYDYNYAVIDGTAYSILSDDSGVASYVTSTAKNTIPSRIDACEAVHDGSTSLGSLISDIDDLNIYTDTNEVLPSFVVFVSDNDLNPIDGAVVTCGSASWVTDEAGMIIIYLPDGSYFMSADKTGYIPVLNDVIEVSDGSYDFYLEEITDNNPADVVISGGAASVYKPAEGSVTVDAFTATVYNADELLIGNAAVDWSIEGEPEGASIADGVVTITSELEVDGDKGKDLVIKASAADDEDVYKTVVLHVYNTARLASFDVVGKTNVKNGTSAAYSVSNAVDQYGVAFSFPAGETATFESDNESFVVADSTATASFDAVTKPVQVKLTATIAGVSVVKTVNVHDYYLYEPGIDTNDHGLEIAAVDGVNATVISSAGTNSVVFAEPLVFEPSSIKEVSWENTFIDQSVYASNRYLHIANGKTDAITQLSYINGTISYGDRKDNNVHVVTDPIATISETNGVWSTFNVLFKTNADGETTATITISDAKGTILGTKTVPVAAGVTQIDRITFEQQSGASARKLAFRNIVAKDSENTGLQILGSAALTKQYGTTVSSTYTYLDTAPAEDEAIIWSHEIVSGSEAGITGTEDDKGGYVLSVDDTAVAGTVVELNAYSSMDALKVASAQVTINDFASLKSFDIVGPVVVSASSKAKYSVANIIDQYDATVAMTPSFEIISGADLATIAEDGTLTAGSEDGNITIAVTVGNPGKTMTKTIDVAIGSYYYSVDATGSVMNFDVSKLIGSASASGYKVSLLKNGSVSEQVVSADNGTVSVNTAGATKVEISPVFKLNLSTEDMNGYVKVNNSFTSALGIGWAGSVPSASANGSAMDSGVQLALADGFYDMAFKKANGNRTDIMLNGHMLGNNVDQYGWGRSSSGALYELKSVKVEGGLAKLTTEGYASNGNIIKYVEVSKNADFAQRKTHIFIGGDSTVTGYYAINDAADGKSIPWESDSCKQTGWSQVLGNYLSNVDLVDLAEGGNYAESWIGSAFPGVEAQAQPGDYFFVQFGINDRNYGSKSVAAMRAALEEMVDRCVAKGIIPVLISPQNSVSLWGSGTNPNGSGNAGYYDGVIESAVAKGALCISLDDLTSEVLGGWGKDYTTANYHTFKSGPAQDTLHLSYQGASLCASLIAGSILTQQNEGVKDAQGNGFDAITVNTDYAYSFTDSNGDVMTFTVFGQGAGAVTKLTVGEVNVGSTSVSVDVENHTASAKTATLIVATRDASGAIVNVALSEVTFDVDDADTITVAIPAGDYASVSTYVWDTTASMKPLK